MLNAKRFDQMVRIEPSGRPGSGDTPDRPVHLEQGAARRAPEDDTIAYIPVLGRKASSN